MPVKASVMLRKRSRTTESVALRAPFTDGTHEEEDGDVQTNEQVQTVPPNSWGSRSGTFWEFQKMLKSQWSDLAFADEFVDPDSQETICKVLNFTGTLSELVHQEKPGFLFRIEDGQLVLTHSVHDEVKKKQNKQIISLVGVWVILFIMVSIIVLLNYQKYIEMLHW